MKRKQQGQLQSMTQTKKIKIEEKKRVQSNFLLSLWAAITKNSCDGLQKEEEPQKSAKDDRNVNQKDTQKGRQQERNQGNIVSARGINVAINEDSGPDNLPDEFRNSQE